MSAIHAGASEMDILDRVLRSGRSRWDADAARAILALGFDRSDEDRMKALLARAKAGALTPSEATEIENYERVGHMLSLMKSKARLVLKPSATDAG